MCWRTKRSSFDRPSLRPRAGLTAIELLVSVAVLAVLIALLLPAVQASRASARRFRCVASQKSLTLAWVSYEEAHGGPPSPLSHVFTLSAPHLGRPGGKAAAVDGGLAALAVCPSDEVADPSFGNFSFLLNRGIGYGTGIVDGPLSAAPRDEIVDGTSNTALWAERLVPFGSGKGDEPGWGVAADPARVVHYLDRDYRVLGATDDGPSENAEWRSARGACRWGGLTPEPLAVRVGQKLVGRSPVAADVGFFTGPNRPSCVPLLVRQTPHLAQQRVDERRALDGPCGRHEGGVNVSRADGSVAFVSDSISGRVWIQLATRASAEESLPGWPTFRE